MASDGIIRPKDKTIPVFDGSGFTEVENIKFKYKWTIDNFSNRFDQIGDEITSPTFPEKPCSGFQWKLLLYPKGYDLEYKNDVSLFLQFVPINRDIVGEDIRGNITFKILNFPSRDILIREFKFNHRRNLYLAGYKQFMQQDDFLKGLTDDKIIIFCEIDIAEDVQLSSIDRIISKRCLVDDFQTLFEYEDNSDVTFFVGTMKLTAHKLILGARSPVFKAMFAHDMEEKLKNNVTITDITYEVMKEMLRFIYTDRVQNLEGIAMDLLVAADKYQLEELRTICEKAFEWKNISIENAAATFIFADQQRIFSFKTMVLNFIQRHAENVMSTSGWKKMMIEYPHLVEEAFCTIAQSSYAVQPYHKRKKTYY